MTAVFIGMIYFVVDGLVSVGVGYFYNGLGVVTPMQAVESLVSQLLILIIYAFIFFGLAVIVKSTKTGVMLGVAFTLFASMIPWAIGNYITHTDLSAFSIDTLTKGIETL